MTAFRSYRSWKVHVRSSYLLKHWDDDRDWYASDNPTSRRIRNVSRRKHLYIVRIEDKRKQTWCRHCTRHDNPRGKYQLISIFIHKRKTRATNFAWSNSVETRSNKTRHDHFLITSGRDNERLRYVISWESRILESVNFCKMDFYYEVWIDESLESLHMLTHRSLWS